MQLQAYKLLVTDYRLQVTYQIYRDQDVPKIYPGYSRDIYDISKRHKQDMPEIYFLISLGKISDIYVRFTVDIPKMYLRCTRDIHEIYPRYTYDI